MVIVRAWWWLICGDTGHQQPTLYLDHKRILALAFTIWSQSDVCRFYCFRVLSKLFHYLYKSYLTSYRLIRQTSPKAGPVSIHSQKKRENIEVVFFAFSKTLRRVNDIIGEIPNLHIRDNDNYNAWLVTAGRVLTDPCWLCWALNQVLMTRNRHIRAGTITCHNYTRSLNKTQPLNEAPSALLTHFINSMGCGFRENKIKWSMSCHE